MRWLPLLLAVWTPVACAQVIECPRFYPWKDTPIAEVPYQHRGKGFVAKARLTGAGIYTGELNGQGELQGAGRKVKGGWDVEHGFAAGEPKWLVCSYANGAVTWWEQLDPKVTHCTLQLREGGLDPMGAKVACR